MVLPQSWKPSPQADREDWGFPDGVYLTYTWRVSAPTHTTIKVTAKVRDDLNEVAAAEGRTAGSMIEKLLADYLWRLEVEAAKKAMREAPQEVWDEYMREFKAWDATFMDGLEDEPLDEDSSAHGSSSA